MKKVVWPLAVALLAASAAQAQQRRITDLAQAWVPEYRVEANFVGSSIDDKKFEGEHGNRMSLKEAGIGLRSYVDPHFRLDVVISGEESAEGSEFGLEQAQITWLDAPGGVEVRLGKFQTSFGEYNDDDPDEHPQVTAPELITAYWGEDDGYTDSGVSMNVYIPNPWDWSNILWLGIFNGENEAAFHGGGKRGPVYFTRYEFFWELAALTGLELGVSYLGGPNQRDSEVDVAGTPTVFEVEGETRMFNVHFELDYRDPKAYLYSGFSFLAEYYQQTRSYEEDDDLTTAARTAGLDTDTDETTNGYYLLGQYSLNRNWAVGGRIDSAPLRLVEFEEGEEEGEEEEDDVAGAYTIFGDDGITAYSLMLSYYPSRFSTLRAQYTNKTIGDETVNEFWLQLQVLIGFERPDVF